MKNRKKKYTKKAQGIYFVIKESTESPENYVKPSSNPPGWEDTVMIQYRVTRRQCGMKSARHLRTRKPRTRYMQRKTKLSQK